MATYSEELGSFVADLSSANVPEDVVDSARVLMLNVIGAGVAGAGEGLVESAAACVADTVGGVEIWGMARYVDVSDAAFANGVTSHVLDFDDTHGEGGVHPSAVLVPAVLAVAQGEERTWGDVMFGLIGGYEVMARLGSAASHAFTRRGFHATSVCGAVAVAAAVGRTRGMSGDSIAHAMGIAASFASGIIQTVAENGELKPLHVGWAAKCGVWAVNAAEAGIRGPRMSIEGANGLLQTFVGGEGDIDWWRVLRGLGLEWETLKVDPKRYPCCHFTHAFIDAAKEAFGHIDLSRVVGVVCSVPREAVNVVCEPWDVRCRPESAYKARFSLPYCVAIALLHGDVSSGSFAALETSDGRLRELIDKISYVVDEETELAKTYGGALVFRFQDGSSTRVDHGGVSGIAADALRATMKDKYVENVQNVYPSVNAGDEWDRIFYADLSASVPARLVGASSWDGEDTGRIS